MHAISQMIIKMSAVALAVLFTTTISARARTQSEASLCPQQILPVELQNRLKADFPSWKVQEPSNLSQRARDRWRGEKPLACPGIASGQFESKNQISYAILLVPTKNPDSAYRLLVLTPGVGSSANSLRVIDQWDKGGASNNFIHTVQISKVFSEEWIRKLQLKTNEGILNVDSGENEYGVEVYFLANGQYQHEPIDY